MTARKPVADMSNAELQAVLNSLTTDEKDGMFFFLAGHSPRALDGAIASRDRLRATRAQVIAECGPGSCTCGAHVSASGKVTGGAA